MGFTLYGFNFGLNNFSGVKKNFFRRLKFTQNKLFMKKIPVLKLLTAKPFDENSQIIFQKLKTSVPNNVVQVDLRNVIQPWYRMFVL